MIYTINEARNVEEYRAEKAAREKSHRRERYGHYNDRYARDPDVQHNVEKIGKDGVKDSYDRSWIGNKNGNEFSTKSTRFHNRDVNDEKRYYDAMKVADRHANDTVTSNEFRDAANRNMRRHPERWDGDKPVKPKTESTIFDNIEII